MPPSQNSCLWLTRTHSDGDRDTNYVLQTPRLTQMRPIHLFTPVSRRDTFSGNPSPKQCRVARFILSRPLCQPAPLASPLQTVCFVNHRVNQTLHSHVSKLVSRFLNGDDASLLILVGSFECQQQQSLMGGDGGHRRDRSGQTRSFLSSMSLLELEPRAVHMLTHWPRNHFTCPGQRVPV